MALLPGLVAVVLLLAVNAFFVAAEFSLVAVDRARIEASAAAGHRGDTRIRGLLRRLTPTMSGCQFGITVAALLLGFVAEPIMARLLTGEAHATGLSVVAAIGAATVLHLVFGEQVPKYVALATPEATIRSLASPLAAYSAATRPLVTGLNRSANAVARRLGVETRDQISTSRTRDELEDLIRQSGAEGSLEQEEADLLWRSIRFGEKTASDILIPRVDVKSLQRHDTATTLARLSQATGFSRFPVVGEDLDDVLGVVHVKVVYGVPANERPTTPVEALMRDVPFVPETQPLDDLFADLRSGRGQMAMIVDEHGGTAGIVTMEDLLEEIVGAIDDEHDRSLPRTNVEDTDSKIVSGRLNLDEVLEATGFEVPEGPYETLAGYVLDCLGHLPQPSEMVEEDGWRVEVVAVFGRRIETLRVVALEEPDATPGGHAS
jgi:CBS domain containing-hemolysin-like protein|tara:strand:+ start:598 stop:1899 length:1302 start_codon:yes stop_codon:yes gene_type:complete